ncbi:hypothetical protein DMA12_18465 [Amycolatopsis balhimycina DSM 5908]|uniref:Uncharacterized protein n=1 Tax=Amycolatopsis balhimycina DSM 5908 TaxID=1081091 RepID=A0A428WKH6_AMYBA|nr:hypothetical protein [Amycolatopsis balhimycina]RSM43578.1 hypothetical protein DMA12_18465 [Amycolatopsis balhimycina DSM 5908]
MTTPAQHDRDLAEGRVARLKRELRDGLATPPGDVATMDELVATAHRLLDAELAFDEARHRLANAELESRHAATQRAVVYFAAAPVLVPLVAGALVLFEVLSPLWLFALVPLFAAGLWIGFGPVRRVADVIRERRRGAWAGGVTAGLLVLALVPWSAAAVFTSLTAVGVAGTCALLWRESRIP